MINATVRSFRSCFRLALQSNVSKRFREGITTITQSVWTRKRLLQGLQQLRCDRYTRDMQSGRAKTQPTSSRCVATKQRCHLTSVATGLLQRTLVFGRKQIAVTTTLCVTSILPSTGRRLGRAAGSNAVCALDLCGRERQRPLSGRGTVGIDCRQNARGDACPRTLRSRCTSCAFGPKQTAC